MQFLELIIFNISTPTINVTTSSAILSPIAAGVILKTTLLKIIILTDYFSLMAT